MKEPVEQRKKQGSVLDRLLLFGGIVFLCIFCITGYFLLRYYEEYRNTKDLDKHIADLREVELEERNRRESGRQETDGAQINNAAGENSLIAINADYIGWLTIPDTEVYYPVVWRDNSYYLSHDFMGEASSHGTIFLDENCSLENDIWLIHGHHMKDGTMFGGLKNYRKEDFRQEHEIIYLDTGEGDEAYEVFAAALIDLTEEGCFNYQKLPSGKEERERYLGQLRDNAFWYKDVEDLTGRILLLSTCEYGSSEQRLVIAAVSNK